MQPMTIYTRDELNAEIQKAMDTNVLGARCDLNHLDLGNMYNLSDLFRNSVFSGDISQWRMDTIQDVRGMFANSMFDGDLSQWNIHSSMCLDGMFTCCFRGTLPNLYHVPHEQRHGVYTTMFDGRDEFEAYLKDKPFGELHAQAIVAGETPTWLDPKQAAVLQEANAVGVGLALAHEERVALLMDKYQGLQQNTEHDPFEVDCRDLACLV